METNIRQNPFLSNYIEGERYAHLGAVVDENLLPAAAWRYCPRKEEDFYFTSSKIVLRKIFYGGWPLSETEVAEISRFKAFVKEQGEEVPVVDAEILRQLMAAKYDLQNALERLKKVLKWRQEAFPLQVSDSALLLLQSGYVYFHGRDRCFKPFLVVRPAVLFSLVPEPTVHDVEQVIFIVLEYLRNNMLIPGQVESIYLVIDLNELGLWNLPYKKVKPIMAATNANYRGLASKIFILNGSIGFRVIWKTISVFLDETSLQKLTLCDANTCDELKALAHPGQLEARFGGAAPNQEAPFWPPRMPPFVVDAEVEEKLVPQEEYDRFLEEHPLLLRKPQ